MSYRITLPHCKIEYCPATPISPHQLLIVGGGRQPAENWLMAAAPDRQLWCIDRGIDICHQLRLVPHYLAGDFDSCHPDSLNWAKAMGIRIDTFNRNKDFTDTQAVLTKAKEENTYTILTGALGNRFDHTFSTLLSTAHQGIKGCLADEQETIFLLYPGETVSLTMDIRPKAISLLPLTATVQNVTTQGLVWELDRAELSRTDPYAISNELKPDSNEFRIEISTGILALYILTKEM